MAIIGNGAQSEFQALAFHAPARDHDVRLFDIDHGASLKLAANLRAASTLQRRDLRQRPRGGARRRHRHHDHGGQGERHHPDARHAGARHAHQRRRRRLPGQDRAATPTCCAPGRCSWSSSRRPASRATCSRCRRDFAVTELWRVLTGQAAGRTRRARDHGVRFRRLRAGGLLGPARDARRGAGPRHRPRPSTSSPNRPTRRICSVFSAWSISPSRMTSKPPPVRHHPFHNRFPLTDHRPQGM